MPLSAAAMLFCAAAPSPVAAPDVFASGVISTEQYESHPAFSKDGKVLLFVRSEPNFSRWKIMQSEKSQRGWSRPKPASFAEGTIAADPYFAPDGRHVYFISARLAPGKDKHDLDIWTVERTASGWGTPEHLPPPVNSPGAEWFPRLQPDGSLYFGSDRPGGHGATDIYRAMRTRYGWQVVNLGPTVNSAGDEYEFEVARDGRSAVMMADRGEGSGGDLYLVERGKTHWLAPRRLGSEINGPGLEVGPLFSRDGKYLYYSSRRNDERLGDIYRVAMKTLH